MRYVATAANVALQCGGGLKAQRLKQMCLMHSAHMRGSPTEHKASPRVPAAAVVAAVAAAAVVAVVAVVAAARAVGDMQDRTALTKSTGAGVLRVIRGASEDKHLCFARSGGRVTKTKEPKWSVIRLQFMPQQVSSMTAVSVEGSVV